MVRSCLRKLNRSGTHYFAIAMINLSQALSNWKGRLLVWLLTVFFSTLGLAQDVTFNNQSEVDAFSNTITTINGNLTIGTSFTTSNIVDLQNLQNLTTVAGNVNISFNHDLLSLAGLDNLVNIGGRLHIELNERLPNLNGLEGLTDIGASLVINSNFFLEEIDGLANVNSLGGAIRIEGNEALQNVDGLSGITTVNSNIWISINSSLMDLDGLGNLTSVGANMMVQSNGSLTDINGLSSLSGVGNSIAIGNNDALQNVDGLIGLTAVGLNFSMASNSVLSDCCAIQGLLSTPGAIGGSVVIWGNPADCSSEAEILASPCQNHFIDAFVNLPCLGADNGSIQIQLTNIAGPYTYTWTRLEDGVTGSGTGEAFYFTINALAAGTYDLIITDAFGTAYFQDGLVLTPIAGSIYEIVELTTTNSTNGLDNGEIHITVAGGTPPYALSWIGGSSGTITGVLENNMTIPFLAQGGYEITIADAVGNIQTIALTLLDETVPVFPCLEPMDIVILNDVSSSVDAVEYEESKQFFVNFINAANVGNGPNDSRAGIIEWSESVGVQIPMTGNLSTLQGYLEYERLFVGGTNPHGAMILGEDYLASVARPDVAKVLVLSTDGTIAQIPPSLMSLADEFKAAGYHIVTIAFDDAFVNASMRERLRQIASIDALAPGAPAYSLLDDNLAINITNLYLCPIDAGNSATVYFDRDGAIDIVDMTPQGGCPTPDNVEVTFTIEAFQELSIPAGTWVTFYNNTPQFFGASPILSWQLPCAIPPGTIETFTVALPIMGPAQVFAQLNDDGNQAPPTSFPITGLEELAYANNISDTTICVGAIPTLQASKYSTTALPICNNIVMYTVDVCNVSDWDAVGVEVMDIPPSGFVLLSAVAHDNSCIMGNGDSFDIPAECCLSITYTYDATAAALGSYNNQGVELSGPPEQVYINFDGVATEDEDIILDGTVDCPSTEIGFTKAVNITETCEDAFVSYTFTIDNQLNTPLQGLRFTDVLPAPMTWAYEPYNLDGLSIGSATFEDGTATFIINEVAAGTVATFSIDAFIGDWATGGVLDNFATLANVPDLESGGVETLVSNIVSTNISVKPELTIRQELNCQDSTIMLSVEMLGQSSLGWQWSTLGGGTFEDASADTTIYLLGTQDVLLDSLTFFVQGETTCGEVNKSVTVALDLPEPDSLFLLSCGGLPVNYEGTELLPGETTVFTFERNPGCDSIVTVSVFELRADEQNVILETCAGVPVIFDNQLFFPGDQQTFIYENSVGCDSIVKVTVKEQEGNTTVGFPNVFSPNADGLNDCFQPVFTEGLGFTSFQLQVFDRWGGLMYSTTDPHACWDATSSGRIVESGVYVWLMEMTTISCPEPIQQRGDVMVIR